MAEVLTQEQIDAMLNSAQSGGPVVVEEKPPDVKDYDFRSPKKFTKERIKALESIIDNYSRLLSSYLTGLLRLYCKVSLVSIEEQKYFEFNNALPDYVMMGIAELRLQNDDELEDLDTVVQLSNTLTYIMIDRLLGGKGEHKDTGDREFTEIEVSVMENIIRNILALMKEPWATFVEVEPYLEAIETNSRVISTMGHDDTMIICMLEIMVIETKALITICMPAPALDEIMQKYTTRHVRTGRKTDINRDKERRDNIFGGVTHTALDIHAVLGEVDLDMHDVLRLQVNDIIPLGKSIDSNIVLSVGGKKWFDGKMGVFNNKKAVKIENVFGMEMEA